LLLKSLPSLGVSGNLPLLESPVELAGLSLLTAVPANGLAFIAEAVNDDGGILETRLSGRLELLKDVRTCGRLSGFNGGESGI